MFRIALGKIEGPCDFHADDESRNDTVCFIDDLKQHWQVCDECASILCRLFAGLPEADYVAFREAFTEATEAPAKGKT